MIKLKELLSLNELKYSDKIKEKHQEKMSRNNSILPNEMSIAKTPPPDNGSKQTLKELYWLLDYNDGKIDNEMIKEGDEVIDVFEKYCKENNLKFDRSYYKKVLKESAKIILKLKYHYNRPRPYQLAEFYGIEDFKVHKLDTANTPSYPSGHSIQGYMMGSILGNKYPSHYQPFMDLGAFVSESRLMARAHFPSDVDFGESIGILIFNSIKGKVK
tara:strand:- start:171 stop:815 length:645 start_codon:yes stop_codon:yes gene_type:complete